VARKKTQPKAKPTKAKKLTVRQRIAANAKACQPDKKSSAGGRSSAYNSSFCQQIIEFMARGYSLTAFAGHIGVARDTVYGWTEKHPEFSDALTKARAARTLYWEKRLEIAGPDARSVIFALRNSCADEWKNDPEGSEVNVTVNNEVKVDTSKPPEQWGAAELEAELAKLRNLGVNPITSKTPINRNGTNGNHKPG
jgi:hypothetical protein